MNLNIVKITKNLGKKEIGKIEYKKDYTEDLSLKEEYSNSHKLTSVSSRENEVSKKE